MCELNRIGREKAIRRFYQGLKKYKIDIKMYSITTEYDKIYNNLKENNIYAPRSSLKNKLNRALAKSILDIFSREKITDFFYDKEFIPVFNEVRIYKKNHYLTSLSDVIAWIDHKESKSKKIYKKQSFIEIININLSSTLTKYYK